MVKIHNFYGQNICSALLALVLSKNANNKKCASKFVLFNEKKMRKIPMIFDIENEL